MSELLHVLDTSSEPRAPQSEATPPPTTVLGVLITRTRPIRRKRIATSRMASDTRHSSEPSMGGKDYLLGGEHVALVYRFHCCMKETREHIYVLSQQGIYQL